MAEEESKFVSRRFVVLLSFFIAFALELTGTVAFWLPHRIFLREYRPAVCTVFASNPGCLRECRVVNVSSPTFPNGMTGAVTLSGGMLQACQSERACNENFQCRFQVSNSSGTNKIIVRKDVPRVAPGFILYTSLAILVLFFLVVWLVTDWFRHSTLMDSGMVHAAIFVPPGPELAMLADAIGARWPVLEARELDFSWFIEQVNPASLIVEAQRKFCRPCKRDKRGIVFLVRANGRNDVHVLEAVPNDFYRICLLVMPEINIKQGRDTQSYAARRAFDLPRRGRENKLALAQSVPATALPMIVEDIRLEQSSESGMEEAGCSSGISDAVLKEVLRLAAMNDTFDFVYEIENPGTVGYRQLALLALSPVVGKRVAAISFFRRLSRQMDLIWNKIVS
jgi:hypothetical protein